MFFETPPAIAALEDGKGSVLCETQLMPHKGQYELERDPKPATAKRKNENGLHIWAKVKNSSNSLYGPGHSIRVHMCFDDPCEANFQDSKYGTYGPPVHMQCIKCIGPKAAPLLPLTAAPVADPSSITTALAVAAQSTTAAVAAQTPAATAGATKRPAIDRIRQSGLQLAREIRTPRTYIGYVAFVLYGLLKRTRPQMWEGANKSCVIETFAPAFKGWCSKECVYAAIPCAVKRNDEGVIEYLKIDEENQLSRMTHYVAGFEIPMAAVAADVGEPYALDESAFAAFYKGMGAHYLDTILDGDCGLDVMCIIEGLDRTIEERTSLREQLSDYLIEHLHLDWMMDILNVTQEINAEDLKLARSEDIQMAAVAADHQWSSVVMAAIACDDGGEQEPVSEDAMSAMRWVSKLNNDCSVLELVRTLPGSVVQEQVRLWNARGTAASAPKQRIVVGVAPTLHVKKIVAQRFQQFCDALGLRPTDRLPRNTMTMFVQEHLAIAQAGKQTALHKIAISRKRKRMPDVRKWHKYWSQERCLVDGETAGAAETAVAARSQLKSRAPVQSRHRKRDVGGGRPYVNQAVRQELYEWFASIRHAIDWQALITNNRGRGLKKNLARFPVSILKVKVAQLLREHCYASLLNGQAVQAFTPDSHWFARWCEDYGLSLRQANRKYSVPRHLLKQRLELFWVSLFRIRKLAALALGYDPMLLNWDQSPYHHNESGSQNKATLAVRGSTVPVVEGNSDCKARWSANLTTCSDEAAVAAGFFPPSECMFKGAFKGKIHARLVEYRQRAGFPAWLTVTMSDSGSYKETDVVTFLKAHLEEWKVGREWRIIFADWYSAHRAENVFELCWSRGYVLILHGGGATPVAQTPDTDLNEEVRRLYGNKESAILMEKMRHGQNVPKMTQEECVDLMHSILCNKELHLQAARGYKKVGQSVALNGSEDNLIVREAGRYWNEVTSDGYKNMRERVNDEMAIVAEHFAAGQIEWNKKFVRKLINDYPTNKTVDAVLERVGEDFSYDDVHDMPDAAVDEADKLEGDGCASEDEAAVAADNEDEGASNEDEGAGSDGEDEPAVAADGFATDETKEASVTLSGPQADAVHQNQVEIASLQDAIEIIRQTGAIRMVVHLERQIDTLKRRQRQISKDVPVVADAFKRLRTAEAEAFRERAHMMKKTKALKLSAQEAINGKNTAVAALAKAKRALQNEENRLACDAAVKKFPLCMLGENDMKAGGKKAKDNRFEVLDRLAHNGAALSSGQRNDFELFKRAWDEAMVEEHKGQWAETFAGWMRTVLDAPEANAFSAFVHSETNRVLRVKVKDVLAVPGVSS